MKKKYGFTLIELLAVITVLSIIALIALPLVVNNIEEEKKQSARISTNEYIKSFHSTIIEVMADNVDKASGLYNINSDGTVSIHNQKYDVSMKGDKPTDGKICVSNQGDVTGAYLKINGYIMSYDGENVEQTDMTEIGDVDCDILDKNTILVLRRPNVTTKSITVPYLVSDTVSGIDNISCFYGTDEKYQLTGEVSSESCNLNNLKNNTLYYYKISAKNNDGTTTTKVGSVKTKDFSDIVISLNPTGWQPSKSVNITGSTEGAILEYKLKKYNYVTKTYDVIDWTKYDSSFTLNTIATPLYPTTIYARLNDGINTKSVSYNEVKIDPTIPELSVIKIDKTTRSIKLPYSVKDDESGIKNVTCVYGIDKKYGSSGTIKSSTCELNNLKSGVIYYYKLTATNNAGLVKEITGNTASEQIDQPIDITSPSVCAKKIPVIIRANIPSGASLQYRIANTGSWTSINSGTSIDITSNTTIYARLYDGLNASATKTHTITKVDLEKPSTNMPNATSTTNSITVTSNQTDNCGLNTGTLQYGISESASGTYSWQTSNKFTGLKANTMYYVKTRVNDIADNGLTESVAKSIQTKRIDYNPSIVVSPSACSKTKSVTISVNTVPEGANLQYRFGSGSWNNISNGSTITATSNTVVYARLYDGVNSSATITYTITTIDTEKPSTNMPNATSTTNSITVTNNQTDNCGLNTGTLQYGISESASGTYSWQTSNKFTGLKADKTYYVKTRVNDIAGNGLTESVTKSIQTKSINYKLSMVVSPNVCSKTKNIVVSVNTVPEGANLQYRLGNGNWINISNNQNVTVNNNTTVYARLYDGVNTSETATYAITTIDLEKPSTDKPNVSSNTSSITVVNNQTDICGLNTGTLQYGISESASGTYSWQTSNKFTGLKSDKLYYIKTRVNDIAGNGLTESNLTSIYTKKINYSLSVVPTSSSCAKSRTFKITAESVPSGVNLQYRIGSTGSWINISNNQNVTVNNSTTVYARLWDGVNASTTASGTAIIDLTRPTSTAPTASSTTKSITVTNKQTDNCGLNTGTLQYGISTSVNGTYTWQSSNNFTGLKADTTYYVKTRVNDIADNGLTESEAALVKTQSIDNYISISATSYCSKTKLVSIKADSVPSGANLQYQIGTSNGNWINISNGTVVSINYNTTVYARLYDGVNSSSTKTYTITTIDTERPNTTSPNVSSYISNNSNYISVTNNQTDNCALDYSTLQYGISTSVNGTYTWQSSNQFTNLADSTTYYVKTRVNDVAGNGLTESSYSSVKTQTVLKSPTITLDTDDWATSKKATINYINGSAYYFKSTVSATSNVSVISCGTGNVPGTCSEASNTTSIEVNVWYKTTSSNPVVTYTNTGVLYATAKNASDSKTSSLSITKVDSTGPYLYDLNNPYNNEWSSDKFNVTYTVSETGVGYDHCEYKYSTDEYGGACQGNSWCYDDGDYLNGTFTAKFSASRSATAYFRCFDKLGNVSNTISTPIKIDRERPTVTSARSEEDYWDSGNNYSCGTSVKYYISVTDRSGIVDVWSTDGNGTVYRDIDFTYGATSIDITDRWSAQGNRGLITYHFKDRAGNVTDQVEHNTTIVGDSCECDGSCDDGDSGNEGYGCCISYDCNNTGGTLINGGCYVWENSGYYDPAYGCDDECDDNGYCNSGSSPLSCSWIDTGGGWRYIASACNWGICYD